MSSAEYSTAISNFVNENTEEGKAFLDKELSENPKRYFTQLFAILKEHSEENVRIFASQSLINNFGLDKKQIDDEIFTSFKSQIFAILEKEKSPTCKKNICKLIGTIGGSYNDDSNEPWAHLWGEFFGTLFALLSAEDNQKLLTGLYILDEYFPSDSEYFYNHMTMFPPLFTKLFASTDNEILFQAIITLAAIIPCIEPSHEKLFKDVSLTVLNVPLQIQKIDEQLAHEAVGEVAGIAEVCRGFFKGKLTECIAFIQKQIENSENSIQMREGYLDVLVNIYCCNTKKMEKNLKEYLNIISTLLSDTIKDPDDEWHKPINSDTEIEAMNQLAIIDRLMGASNPAKALPILKNILLTSLRKSWKHKYFGMMTIAQIAEYLEDFNDLNDLIEFLLNLQDDENPKVRYAVYQCFGQFADDLGKDFIQKHSNIVEKIFKGLNDSSPRVVSHCLFCLGNMFEDGASQEVAVQSLEKYYDTLMGFIKDSNQINILRESALTCISGIAEIADDKFMPYYHKSVEDLYKILKDEDTASKQTKAQCMEAITLMGTAVGKEEFKKITSDLAKIFVDILENDQELSQVNNPYHEYILTGIQRIVVQLEEDFATDIDTILPHLEKVLQAQVIGGPHESEAKVLDGFTVIIGNYPLKVVPYLEKWIKQTQILLLRNPQGEEVTDLMGELYSVIVKNPAQFSDISKYYKQFAETIDFYLKEMEVDLSSNAGKLKNLIEDAGSLLSPESVKEISDNIFRKLNEVVDFLSSQDPNKNKKGDDDDEEEEDDEEDGNEGEPTWDDVTSLFEILGHIFKKHPKKSAQAMQVVINKVVPILYQQEKGKIPAIYIIDDIIEAVDFNQIQETIPAIVKILLEGSKSSEDGIRQASVFGLGIFAKFSGAYFANFCMNILTALKAAIEFQGNNSKNFEYARDNAIAGLGRVIKHQYDLLEDVRTQIGGYWVDQLPLKKDKIEGKEQHELLLDIILTKNASMVFGPNGEKMKKVLEIFASIVGTKMSSKEVDEKIEQVLKGLMQNESMSALMIKAGGELDNKKKAALAKFFS